MTPMHIGPPARKELALESAAGRPIPNEQLAEISHFEGAQFPGYEARYGSRVYRRTDPTPRYNCHGMTFAARRTGIFELAAIDLILDDDGYQEVAPDGVLAGDVVLYFGEYNDVEHSGVVISPPSQDNLGIPLICSKWGKYAEVIHLGNQCPYNFARAKYYRVR